LKKFIELLCSFLKYRSDISVNYSIYFLSQFFIIFLFGFIVSYGINLAITKLFARYFRGRSRMYTPESHRIKDNTPTMGGISFLGALGISPAIISFQNFHQVILIIGAVVIFGLIGFIDDWYKIRQFKGISARAKFILQCIGASILVLLLMYWFPELIGIALFNDYFLWLNGGKILFFLWCVFIIIGTANAVNLTDGLDCLALSVVIPNFMLFLFFAFIIKAFDLVALFCIIIGSLIAFACFNRRPADLWMGDIGSLALGAGLAVGALLLKAELIMPVSAFLLVTETLSVIIQIMWVRLFKKKFFKMAPLHHHLELKGYSENKVVYLFGFLSVISCGLCGIVGWYLL
jgi:phospho-N-acetylmuramoyl-pentapeptide-transferase